MENNKIKDKGYTPENEIKIPPIYRIPPPVIQSINWLYNFFFPWWVLYLAMAYLGYLFIQANPQIILSFDFKLIALIWLKNFFFLFLFLRACLNQALPGDFDTR